MKYLLSLGVGGVLAFLMFHHHTKAANDWKSERREMHEFERNRADQLMTIVKENTAAFANVMKTTEALHRRLDHELRHHRGADRFRLEGDENG